jgi:hypothetical protein
MHNPMQEPVRIRLACALVHDGADYMAGDVLELPAYQAIGYIQENRAIAIVAVPEVPPLTSVIVPGVGAAHGDPATQHGDPAEVATRTEGEAGAEDAAQASPADDPAQKPATGRGGKAK